MSMRIDAQALKSVKGKVKMIERRLNNPKPVFRTIGSYLSLYNRKMFSTNGAYGGKAWKPLKPNYLQWKIKSGYNQGTLVRTGRLKRSYVSRPMDIEKYLKNSARYGTKVKYAQYHHEGTSKMPARPVMKVTKKMSRSINKIVADYLVGNKTQVKRLIG